MVGGNGWTPWVPIEHGRARLERGVERLARSRLWSTWTALSALVTGVILAGFLPSALQDGTPQWTFIIEHSRGPLFDPDVGPDGRLANLTFRIVPRLIGKVLFFDHAWSFFLLQLVGGFALLVILARLLEEALRDRRTAIVATFGSVGLWAVASAWVETRGNFDGLAMTFVLAAMFTRRWPLIALAGLVATFTDERVMFVLPLVAIWHLVRADQLDATDPPAEAATTTWRTIARPPVLAVVAAGLLHLAVRALLKARYGLSEGGNRSPGNPWAQLNNYPNGLWGALEGYWLFAVAGLLGLYRTGRRISVAVGAVTMAVSLTVGLSVFDISRSVMYVLPVVPVAAVGLRSVSKRWNRDLVWISASVSLLWPMLYAADEATVNWVYPLPLLLIDHYLNG